MLIRKSQSLHNGLEQLKCLKFCYLTSTKMHLGLQTLRLLDDKTGDRSFRVHLYDLYAITA